MFAIYNNGSVGFRSTADNLYELKKTDSPSKVFLKPDDDDLFQEYLSKRKEKKTSQAIDTYKKMANIDISEIVYHVKDIMTENPQYIENSNKIIDAFKKLKEVEVNQIPIIDLNKKIIGIINKKMILNMIMEEPSNIHLILEQTIKSLSLPELITTDPLTDIRRVAKVMTDFKLDAIPVVNEEHILVGIVSKTDIIKAISHIPKLQLWS